MRLRIASLLVVIILIGLAHTAWAQPQPKNLDFGITAGVNISTHTDKYRYAGDIAFTPQRAAGYQLGMMVRYKLADLFSVQANPSVMMLGARYEETFNQENTQYWTDTQTRLLYLQLPVKLVYPLNLLLESVAGITGLKNEYHLSAGLFGNYLYDADLKGSNYAEIATGGRNMESFSRDIINSYSKYDAGLLVGWGMEYENRLGFDLELQYTLKQIYNSNPVYKPKNRAIVFAITYLI